MAGKTLTPGIYVQTYMDKIPGHSDHEKQQSFIAKMPQLKAHGITGILWHGWLTKAQFEEYTVTVCNPYSIKSMCAFGMGASGDPIKNGKAIGTVGTSVVCDGVVLDCEGAFDAGKQQFVKQMGVALRSVSPDILVCDQSWMAPMLHSGFPYEEFNEFVDVNMPQEYCNDHHEFGAQRYEKCKEWCDSQWAHLQSARLAPRGLVKPVKKTFQSYGWDDIPGSLVQCLFECDTTFWWSEWYPSDTFFTAIEQFQKLKGQGYSTVAQFQTAKGLTADGIVGPMTWAAIQAA